LPIPWSEERIPVNARDDETHVVSQAQLHALKNRLTVIKGVTQLMWRQMKRENVGSPEIRQKVGVLHAEIAAMEDEIAGVVEPRTKAGGSDSLSLAERDSLPDVDGGSPA
jgi:hypothetical protein